MSARVYLTEAQALRVQAAVDAAEGYPRAGVAVGQYASQRSIPDDYSEGAFGWTAHAVAVRRHPTRREFAIPDVEATRRNEGRDLPVDAGPPVRLEPEDVVELDATWDGDAGPVP